MVIKCEDTNSRVSRVNDVVNIHRIEKMEDEYHIYYESMRSKENRIRTKWFTIIGDKYIEEDLT